MVSGVSIASILGIGATAISGSIALTAWRHRTRWMAVPFTILAISLAIWPLVYAVQLSQSSLESQLFWQGITLGVAGFVPITWLFFVVAYTGREAWFTSRRMLIFAGEPIAFLILCVTNPVHQLVWTEVSLRSTVVGDVPSLTFGIGYGVHIAFAYTVVAAGIVLLLLHASHIAPMYQKQVVLLITAALPPFVSHIAWTMRMSPIPHLDLTPFVFAFTGIVFGLALFRFELLKLTPVARNQALDEVGDGIVVVDSTGAVVDLIGVAADVLEPTPIIGAPIESVFPNTSLDDLDGREIPVSINGRQREYLARVVPLTDHVTREIGTMIILRDVTRLAESRQRLAVSDRVLRHNLRNDMNLVLGLAANLEVRLDDVDARDARRIQDISRDLIDLANKARQLTNLRVIHDGSSVAVDVIQLIEEVIDELETQHETVPVTIESCHEPLVDIADVNLFRLAIVNILENAIEHNDTENPAVSVSVVQNTSHTSIVIEDNGPGIPLIEREAIESGVETPLTHGQGLGLWITYWCVRLLDGSLEIDSIETGTRITITVPSDQSASQPGVECGDNTVDYRCR